MKVDAASSTCPENPAQFCRRIRKPNRSNYHLSPDTHWLTRWLSLNKFLRTYSAHSRHIGQSGLANNVRPVSCYSDRNNVSG